MNQSDQMVAWKSNASWDVIKARASLLRKVREFFYRRNVIEVETPLLSRGTITDPHISPFNVDIKLSSETYYLQTSPEYAMKRLLAGGADSIFQIAKSFRDDEMGKKHNPEFTLLEWYRLGWDHTQLIDEVNELLRDCLGCDQGDIVNYHDLFQEYCQIDPHSCDEKELERIAVDRLDIGGMYLDNKDAWLDLLFSHCIEPHLGKGKPTFVVDYPRSQAALAQVVEVSIGGSPVSVAQRFEVFVDGMELANGYHELTDALEQRNRFNADLTKNPHPSTDPRPIDLRLLAAMESGLPPCAGVAMGLDRLLMLVTEKAHLSEVLAFDFSRA